MTVQCEQNNFSRPIFYLGSEGDSIELKIFSLSDKENASGLNKLNLDNLSQMALACKTHEQVLDFLENMQKMNSVRDYDFYHCHNIQYKAHAGTYPKGVAHECSLDAQIKFVKHKISEKELGSELLPNEAIIFKAVKSEIFGSNSCTML